MLGQMQILQQSVEHAVRAKNRLPRIGPHQITDPERNDHQLVEDFFLAPAWNERKYARGYPRSREERVTGAAIHMERSSTEVNQVSNITSRSCRFQS